MSNDFETLPRDTGDHLTRLRDALDHIMRIAGMSHQMTKRTYWIQARAKSALDGDDNWRLFDYPKDRNKQKDKQINKLRELHNQVVTSDGLKCPNCDDVGFSIGSEREGIDESGERETWSVQVQCEFCHTVSDSIFNRSCDLVTKEKT